MKSYLIWEFNSLVQYSCYVKKTSSASVGTLAENTQYNMVACVAKGVVDYAFVDPQVIVYCVAQNMAILNPKFGAAEFKQLMSDTSKHSNREKSGGKMRKYHSIE